MHIEVVRNVEPKIWGGLWCLNHCLSSVDQGSDSQASYGILSGSVLVVDLTVD